MIIDIRLHVLAVTKQCIEKVADFYIAVPVGFSADIIHFTSDLFKIIKCVGKLVKHIVRIIFQTQMGKIDQSG